MKLLIMSDLHLEHAGASIEPGDYDVAILAGDIQAPGRTAVDWAVREPAFAGKPVLFVPGNHEYYGTVMGLEKLEMRQAAVGTNVHLLDRDELIIGGVRFLGLTLWTDFAAAARTQQGLESNVQRATDEARQYLNDFRRVRVQLELPHVGKRKLRPSDTIVFHSEQRQWLLKRLSMPFDGKTVVISHHAPHRSSIETSFESSWLTPAFVTEMPETFFGGVELWVHGHTHAAFDYEIEWSNGQGACRVICNPRGYPRRDKSFEVDGFNPRCIVEL